MIVENKSNIARKIKKKFIKANPAIKKNADNNTNDRPCPASILYSPLSVFI